MRYIYLHGFASSPRSRKARYVGDRFRERGIDLVVPDLNQGDFRQLTLTRQVRQIIGLFPPSPEPVTLIGSSFGGLTSAWIAQQQIQVERLVLLAPAFQFRAFWSQRLGDRQIQQWQQDGHLSVYHYAEERQLPLDYQFYRDLQSYDENDLQRQVPTLILHGVADEIVPVAASRAYAKDKPWVCLQELDSDHALANALPEIWQATEAFCWGDRETS